MKEKIIVIGGGGHAKVLISILKKNENFEIIGYLDMQDKGSILGTMYLGNDDMLSEPADTIRNSSLVMGIGMLNSFDAKKRVKIFYNFQELGYSFPTIYSTDSIVNEEVNVEMGTVFFDLSVVNSGTKIGKCAIINTNASIDHDCDIGDFVHIAPGATLSGGVRIGNNTMVGAGSTIIENINITDNVLIGAGSTVVKNITEPGLYYGSPARKIK